MDIHVGFPYALVMSCDLWYTAYKTHSKANLATFTVKCLQDSCSSSLRPTENDADPWRSKVNIQALKKINPTLNKWLQKWSEKHVSLGEGVVVPADTAQTHLRSLQSKHQSFFWEHKWIKMPNYHVCVCCWKQWLTRGIPSQSNSIHHPYPHTLIQMSRSNAWLSLWDFIRHLFKFSYFIISLICLKV